MNGCGGEGCVLVKDVWCSSEGCGCGSVLVRGVGVGVWCSGKGCVV